MITLVVKLILMLSKKSTTVQRMALSSSAVTFQVSVHRFHGVKHSLRLPSVLSTSQQKRANLHDNF